MPKGKKMDARVSCTTEVRDALREVCKGANVDYDDLLRHFLDAVGVSGDSPSPVDALKRGLELRDKIQTYEQRMTKQRTKRNSK